MHAAEQGGVGASGSLDIERRAHNDALLTACRRGLSSMVDLLLSHGVSALTRDNGGDYPLLVAGTEGHREVVSAFDQGYTGVN